MEVRAVAVSVDISTTSTSKMPVGRRDNLMARKSDEHTKTPSWFANTKVYLLVHFLIFRREERNRVRKLSQPRWLDKEKQHVMRREKTDTDLELSSTLYLVVLTRVRAPAAVFTLSCPAVN